MRIRASTSGLAKLLNTLLAHKKANQAGYNYAPSALVLAVLLLCLSYSNVSHADEAAAGETSVQVIALFNDRAMFSVNGARAKIIKNGQVYKGVKLIESSTEQAVIEIAGQRETVRLNSGLVLSRSLGAKAAEGSKKSTQIYADNSGFFRSSGMINGQSLEFLVDTGANLVVLSGDHADHINLDYQDGTLSYASTASGRAPMYLINLDTVSFSGLELRDIAAGVIVGGFPQVPLLGMTFLEKLDMNRSGDVMVLKKRY